MSIKNNKTTIEITIPDDMPCIMMCGTDDELPLAMELIKEMGLISTTPTPIPTHTPIKSRIRSKMVNRNQRVPEGSISGKILREIIDRAMASTEDSDADADSWHGEDACW